MENSVIWKDMDFTLCICTIHVLVKITLLLLCSRNILHLKSLITWQQDLRKIGLLQTYMKPLH